VRCDREAEGRMEQAKKLLVVGEKSTVPASRAAKVARVRRVGLRLYGETVKLLTPHLPGRRVDS
jgi:hypothetical protein